MATHFRILAWRIPWTEEPGGLQSMGSQESDTTEAAEHAHTCSRWTVFLVEDHIKSLNPFNAKGYSPPEAPSDTELTTSLGPRFCGHLLEGG